MRGRTAVKGEGGRLGPGGGGRALLACTPAGCRGVPDGQPRCPVGRAEEQAIRWNCQREKCRRPGTLSAGASAQTAGRRRGGRAASAAICDPCGPRMVR